MSNKDDLQFMESGQDDVLFDKTDSQTHTFTNFPTSAVDEDEDEADQSQLLKDEKKVPSFWTFEYYQQFFDVETHQVFHRVAGSMMPLPNRNYLQSQIRPSPDLYGPFWICTTLVFTTAIAGNLTNYLSSEGKDYQWKYDFHKVTFAATAIFSYWWLIPSALYGLLWWRKSQAGYTFLEILCLYGYSLAIYIPISILWVINITWFKWILVIVGALLSGGVLVMTFWPAVKDEPRKFAIIVSALIFIFHLLLAAGFVLYFFHVPVADTPIQVQTTSAVPLKHGDPEKLQQDSLKNNRLKTEANVNAVKEKKKDESVADVNKNKTIEKSVKKTTEDKQANVGNKEAEKPSKKQTETTKEKTNIADKKDEKQPIKKRENRNYRNAARNA